MFVYITTELTEEWSNDPEIADPHDVLSISVEYRDEEGHEQYFSRSIPNSTKRSVQEWLMQQGIPVGLHVAQRLDGEAIHLTEINYLYDTSSGRFWREV